MTTEELWDVAAQCGVEDCQRFRTTKQIVWAIQHARGEERCFLSDLRVACGDSRCQWRSECMRLIAEWRR